MKKYININGRVIQLLLALIFFKTVIISQQAPNLISDYCSNLTVNITNESNLSGCFFVVEFKQIWFQDQQTVVKSEDLPHGLLVEFVGATINTNTGSITILDGEWFTSAPAANPIPSGSSIVYWNKQPGFSNSTIPTGEVLKVKIKVTTIASSVQVKVRELTGWSWPNYLSYWNCEKSQSFTFPTSASIGEDVFLCTGSDYVINIDSPPLPIGTIVTWYKSNSLTCPTTNPPSSGWTQVSNCTVGQLGDCMWFNTNILQSSACYIAVINTGCIQYATNAKKITVCPGPPSGTITTISPYSSPIIINNQIHSCNAWHGEIKLTLNPSVCTPTTVVWELITDDGPAVVINPPNQYSFIETLGLSNPEACSTKYTFRATLNNPSNACGQSIFEKTIIIDHEPDGGTITTKTLEQCDVGSGTTTAPLICKETRLKHSTTCGKIKQWEYVDEIGPACSNNWPPESDPWTIETAAGTSSEFWTNELTKSRKYRVLVENGACNYPVNSSGPDNSTYSEEITVLVKPSLIVTSINTTSNLLCNNPTITVTTSFDNCIYHNELHYQWYQNGISLGEAGQNPSLTPSSGGEYSVVVTDNICRTDTSKIVNICGPAVSIVREPCICKGKDFKLKAEPNHCFSCPESQIIYHWTGPGIISNPDSQIIICNGEGTYTVTASYPAPNGNCQANDSTIIDYCPD